ncbi:MAG: response regulator [Candidatus Omnitrophica bacterium]|nr:response regulator [Candidatus Omnitrophota bacterium]
MGGKILIVDDELDFIKLLTIRLEHAGYGVEFAVNGKEAVGAYVKSLNDEEPISLILLDIVLPDINGIEVLTIIRKEEQSRGIKNEEGVPIFMLTGYDRPWMDPSELIGTDDYIVKPINAEELLKKIENRLNEKELK